MNTNKDKTINQFRQAIAGTQKHFAQAPTIALDGTPTAPKDVIAALQGAIDAIDVAAVAEKAFHDAVVAEHAALVKGRATLAALKRTVKVVLGGAEGTQGDFGFTTRKRQVPKAATKAEAVNKRAQTRKAHGTMGKRQKAKVTAAAPAAPAAQPPVAKPA